MLPQVKSELRSNFIWNLVVKGIWWLGVPFEIHPKTFLIKFVGDNLTGRRTLISKIINDDKDPYRGHGLSYEYINITGKDEEECGCLSFITVDPSAPIRAQERVCTSFNSSQTIKSDTCQKDIQLSIIWNSLINSNFYTGGNCISFWGALDFTYTQIIVLGTISVV